MTTERTSSTGAYGFRIEGLDEAGQVLMTAPPDWPRLRVAHGEDRERPALEFVSRDRAEVWLADGAWAELDREAGAAKLRGARAVPDSAIVHPYLAPVVLVMARWLGREGFHGGAIVAGGGAWVVLGEKEAGKSTTLARLAERGVPVVSDDVIILDDLTVFAGPRSIDLRPDAARRLGVGESLGRVGNRERWRVPLAPIVPELPLLGWITLEWGDEISCEPLRGRVRLAALLPHRGVRAASLDPAALVRLTELPHLRLRRPRDWGASEDALERLLATISS